MSCYELTYRLTMCYPNFIAISICMNQKIKNKNKMAFSLEFVSLRKKNNSLLLLLLNICKLSYFIGYKCLNFN